MDFEKGEVVTHLNHYKSGNTQLARDVFSLGMLETILRNPRVHTNTGRHVGHLHSGEDEDFGYRSGYSSGDYSSPRTNYFSDDGYTGYSPRTNYFCDDGYSPRSDDGYRASQSRARNISSSEDRGGRDKSGSSWVWGSDVGMRRDRGRDNSRVRRDWSRSRSRDNSRVRRGRKRSQSRSRDNSRVRRDRSRSRRRDYSSVRRGRSQSRDRSPRRMRRSRKG